MGYSSIPGQKAPSIGTDYKMAPIYPYDEPPAEIKDDEEIVGLLVGVCFEYWFGTDKQIAGVAIYVKPGKRGTSAAGRLIRAYEKWASNLGIKEIGVSTSTGVETERTRGLFQRLGYTPAAYAYSKRIEQ